VRFWDSDRDLDFDHDCDRDLDHDLDFDCDRSTATDRLRPIDCDRSTSRSTAIVLSLPARCAGLTPQWRTSRANGHMKAS